MLYRSKNHVNIALKAVKKFRMLYDFHHYDVQKLHDIYVFQNVTILILVRAYND